MRLQGCPRGVAAGELFLADRGVNFSVTDAVHRMLFSPALAFGQEVMLVNALACHEHAAAERAVAQRLRGTA